MVNPPDEPKPKTSRKRQADEDQAEEPGIQVVLEVDELGRPKQRTRAADRKAAIHMSQDPRVWTRIG